MESLREINARLKQATPAANPEYYPPAERAGFNFGRAVCTLIETIYVNNIEEAAAFLRGLLKPLFVLKRYLTKDNMDNES